ncbi:Macro domain-containing protein, partial [Globisporangium splendens]
MLMLHQAVSPSLEAPPSSSSLGLRVLAVEEIARTLLLLLDVRSIDAMLASIHKDAALHGYLCDTALWSELLDQHFLGRIPADLRFLGVPQRVRSWDWTDASVACRELQEFLRSGDERAHFERTVTVVRGDIGYVQDIDGKPLDGLGFPTNSHLTNHYIGAAGAIFRRAGNELNTFVNDPLFRGRRRTGEAVVTPAFNAGVSKLIHCVGPRITQPECYELLGQTYEALMTAVLREDLECVAIASISTGNMSIPAKEGAQVAMRAIQKFIRSNHWEGSLAVVCFEDSIFNAFTSERTAVLQAFNAQPPLPTTDVRVLPWM